MKTAIDNYSVGRQKEVDASIFRKQTINVSHRRFICSECGELVGLSKRGHFYHTNKTIDSPNCDKRSDATSTQSIYERMGLPLYIRKIDKSTFSLYMGFYALAPATLESAQATNLSVIIRDSSNTHSLKLKVDAYSFSSEYTILHEIPFVPSMGCEFTIEYSNAVVPPGISTKWASYADGFTIFGAIFTYSETGGRKIRKASSISTDEPYLLAWHTCNMPEYTGLIGEYMGELRLSSTTYYIFKVTFSSNVSQQQFIWLADLCRESFKVSLLYKEPEILPLWPPCKQQDNAYITLSGCNNLICEVVSGNERPVVYQYYGNKPISIECEKITPEKIITSLRLGHGVYPVSVDRKFGGNITFVSNNFIDYKGFKPQVILNDGNNIEIPQGIHTVLPFAGQLKACSNFKGTIYHKKPGQLFITYQLHSGEQVTIVDITFRDELFLYAGNIQRGYWGFRREITTQTHLSDNKLYLLLSKGSLPKTSTPIWVKYLLDDLKEHPRSMQLIKSYISERTIPIGSLKVLNNYLSNKRRSR